MITWKEVRFVGQEAIDAIIAAYHKDVKRMEREFIHELLYGGPTVSDCLPVHGKPIMHDLLSVDTGPLWVVR